MSFTRVAVCAVAWATLALSSAFPTVCFSQGSPGFGGAGGAATPEMARKVHVLIYADTRDRRRDSTGAEIGIGLGAEANAASLKALFDNQLNWKNGATTAENGVLPPRKGAQCTVAQLKIDITALNVQPTDTVCVWMCCHGTFLPNGQVIQMDASDPNSVIRRSEIIALIKGKLPRQSILITDSCANIDANEAPAAAAAALTDSKILGGLLLYHSGVVSINACGVREFSWYYTQPKLGSYFTNAFTQASQTTPLAADGSDWTWDTLFKSTQTILSRTPGSKQTPAVF